MQLTVKQIFLIDTVGALISTILLGIVLPAFQHFIGFPLAVLWGLSGVALLLFVYSFSCYKRTLRKPELFLRGIGILNLLYIIATLSLVWMFWDTLTILGVIYFSSEAMIVSSLGTYEIKRSLRY